MVQALHFDGRSGRGQPVRLAVEDGCLVARPEADAAAAPARWPLAEVRWPERTRHGQRVVHLRDGGSLQAADAAAFDAWRRSNGPREGWVVRAQQHWRGTLAALVLVLAVGAAGYQWGVPALARGVLALVPATLDDQVGAAALSSIEARWLKPSTVPAARQLQLQQALAAALDAAHPGGKRPAVTLRFHDAGQDIGPNAFALPGGTIVLTDAMVALLQDQDDTLVGVLAHEFGHVQHRHGMRALVQFTLLSTAASAALGDFSSVLAGLPALVAQLGYSRDAEREADAVAARVLRASGRSPAVMAVLFERLPKGDEARSPLPMALASHPFNEERVRFFREAAAASAR